MPIRSAAGIGLLVAAVVASATVAGLHVPGIRIFGVFGHSALDYGRPTGEGFSPLRPDLIAALLGLDPTLDEGTTGALPGSGGNPLDPTDREGATIRDAYHDDFADAAQIHRIEYTDVTRTTAAGREPGEPTCGNGVGGSVWYRYSPPRDLWLQASTVGSDYGTSLAVFEGTSMSNLKRRECWASAAVGVIADFKGLAGRTYYIQVSAATRGGTLVFHLGLRAFTRLASTTDDGTGGNQWSADGALSRDGRNVLMWSYATDLARGSGDDPTTCAGAPVGYPGVAATHAFSPSCIWRIYLRDRSSGVTDLVTQTTSGIAATDAHADFSRSNAAMSGNGRFVVFSSASRILDPQNTVGTPQIYLRDRHTRTTTRLIPPAGAPSANRWSANAQLSADGRTVLFDSDLPDLVPGDTNGVADVFRMDRATGRIARVSLSSTGSQLPGRSSLQQITPDGRFALVLSESDHVTHGDDNGFADLFVYDVARWRVDRVSVGTKGTESNSNVYRSVLGPSNGISDDGRFVVFMSGATTLVPNDTNAAADSFLRDRAARTTRRMTVSITGEQATGGDRGFSDPLHPEGGVFYAEGCAISGDGRYVMLSSQADNLIPGDFNNGHDVFLVDRLTGVARTASLGNENEHMAGPSFGAALSGDGQTVLFTTLARNRDGASPGSAGDLYVRVLPHTDRPVRLPW